MIDADLPNYETVAFDPRQPTPNLTEDWMTGVHSTIPDPLTSYTTNDTELLIAQSINHPSWLTQSTLQVSI